jgi:putative tryptophan/tyrosine transport system substrate-binding protein
VKRREFIAGLGGVAALPVAAHAQQYDRVRRIGMLWPYAEGDPEANAWLATFREELEKLGWVEGRNVRIDHRWAALDEESVQRFARELVALQPDITLTQSTPNTAALLQQTRTIPIVLTQGTDPVLIRASSPSRFQTNLSWRST